MKTKLVTAIYIEIDGHPYYGHGVVSRFDRYFCSMRTLNNLNTEIICYCDEEKYDMISEYIKTNNLNNYTLKISNLSSLPYAEKMKEIKEKTDDFKFYHEVDWNKFYLLEKEYDETYDYIYWIDIGISHNGLFPHRYNPNHHLSTGLSYDYNTFSFTLAFTDTLFTKINNFIGEKLLLINTRIINPDIHNVNKILDRNLIFDRQGIGGFLGGHISNLKWFIDNFKILCDISINSDFILNHESLISVLYQENKDKFETFVFDTWYHEDLPYLTDQEKKNLVPFSKFFDLILNT